MHRQHLLYKLDQVSTLLRAQHFLYKSDSSLHVTVCTALSLLEHFCLVNLGRTHGPFPGRYGQVDYLSTFSSTHLWLQAKAICLSRRKTIPIKYNRTEKQDLCIQFSSGNVLQSLQSKLHSMKSITLKWRVQRNLAFTLVWTSPAACYCKSLNFHTKEILNL